MPKKTFFRLFLLGFGLSFLILAPLYAAETAPSPPSAPQATGQIAGTLGYPSDEIPPLIVYAFQSNDYKKFQKVETVKKQTTFVIPNLAPGTYVVVAYPKSNDPLQGGYTKAVSCGLMASCTDHSLIPITVEAGKTSSKVEVKDWYAPDHFFPPKP